MWHFQYDFRSSSSAADLLTVQFYLLKQSIIVLTKHKTEHKRPVCEQYLLTLAILQQHTFISMPKFKSCIKPWALDKFKAFDRIWHTGLLHKLKSYGISGKMFGLNLPYLSNRPLWVTLNGKFSYEYTVNAGVSWGFILGPRLFLLYINNLLDDAICNIAIYADDTNVYP